jgi:hypothetical protein
MKPRQTSLDHIPMLLSGVILSLEASGFGDKHSRSGIFGLGDGGTDFDRGGMSSLLGGGVSSEPVFPGVASDDGAGIGVFGDDIFSCVVGMSVCVSCTAISGALEIDNAPVPAIAFSAASRSAFFRKILSTDW